MTLDQAREAIAKEYPQQEIGLGFEYKGAWYFTVGKDEYGGIHAVDDATGIVTGNLPIMILMSDKNFVEALKKETGDKKEESPPWRENNFLSHHGILGQKWGVRRFQDKNGRLTAEGKARYGAGKTDSKNGVVPELIAAAVLATAMVAPTVIPNSVRKHNVKLGDRILDRKGIADTDKIFTNDNPPKRIEGEHTAKQDMAKVNEAFGDLRPQTLNNCSMCSITMELRRRGFDVCARTSTVPVYTSLQLNKGFKPPPEAKGLSWIDKPDNYDELPDDEKNNLYKEAWKKGELAGTFKEIEKNMLRLFPEGARGLFSALNWRINVGHAMAFEIENGKVVIYDAQTNHKYSLSSMPVGFQQCFSPLTSLAYRLDDKEINWDGMNDICAERKRK